MNDQVVHHFPPELIDLLVDAIPRLIKGKQGVLDFFKGCGVPASEYADLQATVRENKESITKFEIVRQIVRRINDAGDKRLRERREVLRRTTQWDDFSRGYENDRIEAEGYVAKIQKIVNMKDSFGRMQQAHEDGQAEIRRQHDQAVAERTRLRQERQAIRDRLTALFVSSDPHGRGTELEKVLNEMFRSFGISVRESFRRTGQQGEGVVEQIDGVIELDGAIYLVEMKWWSSPLGPDAVSQHLVRVFTRNAVRGILISQSNFTDAAVNLVRESLPRATFVLAELAEIVLLLEAEGSLVDFFKAKIQAAAIDKDPLFRPLNRSRSGSA